jgi:hypothetical protein
MEGFNFLIAGSDKPSLHSKHDAYLRYIGIGGEGGIAVDSPVVHSGRRGNLIGYRRLIAN